MAPAWLVCCVARGGEYEGAHRPRDSAAWRSSAVDEFFDCFETESELRAATSIVPAHRQFRVADNEGTPVNGRTDCFTACTDAATACCGELVGELAEAAKVLEQTRTEWARRVVALKKDALAELQWADLSQARRMLKANIGDVKKAVAMFLQALEFRVRDRELFTSLRCDVRCDMHIIGSDITERPVVYLCARSQTEPLRFLRDQFILTLEEACKISQGSPEGEGRVYFIMDMIGLCLKLNMDAAALKDLAEVFNTVFAERIYKIMIVDFSRAAQAGWWLVKPLLSEVTRNKFAFVGTAKALEIGQRDFDGATYERMQKTFQVNRDPALSPQDRLEHARRTAMHEVPLGPPSC